MRVLTVGNFYPPHHHGGYEIIWQGTVRRLRALGHDVRVLASDHAEPGRPAAEEDADVHRELRMYWRDYAWPRLPIAERVRLERHNHAALRRHTREFRPDVVSWWSMGGVSLSLIEAVRRDGLPACGVVCDGWLDYAFRTDGWLAPWARRPAPLRRLAARAAGIPTHVDPGAAGRWLFISRTTQEQAEGALGAPLPDAHVAHSGIEAGRFTPAPPHPEFRHRLLYAGRLDPRKGLATAVEALALLPAEATLRFVGTGAEQDVADLRALARERGIADRVTWDDQVAHGDLQAVYAGADVVLFPVEWPEPWGLVPLEAMAVGRPVVATGTGGSGEYLRDGENCVLFDAGDPAALAAAVERLADDPTLRERLREGGARAAATYTEEAFNVLVERHLREVVQSAATAR